MKNPYEDTQSATHKLFLLSSSNSRETFQIVLLRQLCQMSTQNCCFTKLFQGSKVQLKASSTGNSHLIEEIPIGPTPKECQKQSKAHKYLKIFSLNSRALPALLGPAESFLWNSEIIFSIVDINIYRYICRFL